MDGCGQNGRRRQRRSRGWRVKRKKCGWVLNAERSEICCDIWQTKTVIDTQSIWNKLCMRLCGLQHVKVTKSFNKPFYMRWLGAVHSICIQDMALMGTKNFIRKHWTSPEIKSGFSHKNANVCVQHSLKAAAVFVCSRVFEFVCLRHGCAFTLSLETAAALMNGKLLWSQDSKSSLRAKRDRMKMMMVWRAALVALHIQYLWFIIYKYLCALIISVLCIYVFSILQHK